MLQTWLRLQEHWRTTPAVLAEPIDAPLFVVGPPRTGTTILLELLALDPSLRAPLAWEAVQPLPRLDDPVADVAERRRLAEAEQELWADIDPEFMTMHELASDLPCECVHFLAYDFAGPYWSMLYDTPSFTGWQLEHLETLGRVYRLHRRMLQTFQHGDAPRRWLLKSPAHVSTLPAALRRVPRRARDPHPPRPAQVHRVAGEPARRRARDAQRRGRRARARPGDGDDVPVLPRGRDRRSATTARCPPTASSTRTSSTSWPIPVANVHGLYEQLGLDWPAGHDARIRDYLAAKPKGKHGEHRYSFDAVGLDEDHVRATFAAYVAHYGITEE